MDAEVVAIRPGHWCSARLANDILVDFAVPAGAALRLGDRLRFDDLELDAPARVHNVTQATTFTVHVAACDVHDLRRPAGHGEPRTPTPERLREDS